MTYLAHRDQTCTRSPNHATGNANGRAGALKAIELSDCSIVTSLSGTHH